MDSAIGARVEDYNHLDDDREAPNKRTKQAWGQASSKRGGDVTVCHMGP